MRVKNFLIGLIALSLSAAFISFAQETTPVIEIKPAAASIKKESSSVVKSAKKDAQPLSAVKPAPNLFAAVRFQLSRG